MSLEINKINQNHSPKVLSFGEVLFDRLSAGDFYEALLAILAFMPGSAGRMFLFIAGLDGIVLVKDRERC